ncbi:MAG: Calx-beta domain-containing protein [Xanthomonadales bacterium]|nr:Calx-beta domain-containing protein [Xanthomonadales bacterium]
MKLRSITLIALFLGAGVQAQEISLISTPEDPLVLGVQGNADSSSCRLGGNRYVVFSSTAQNLVPGDQNGSADIFLRDRAMETLERVSVDDAGLGAPGNSLRPDVSDDGRFVVFESAAVLAPGAPGTGVVHVFLRDRTLGTTKLISRTATEVGNAQSSQPRINASGTQVVFRSAASNLVTGDTDNCTDIFVYDLATESIQRASTTATGGQANNCHHDPDIADDGRTVVFLSDASDLVGNDNNFHRDLFRKDLVTGVVDRLSVDPSGGDPDRSSQRPSITDGGEVVAFASRARNLVTGDNFLQTDIFLHDPLLAPPIVRINLPEAGGEANRQSEAPAISGDGQFTVFESRATNLVATQIVAEIQPFFYDRGSASLTPLLTVPGTQATGPAISPDGSLVCVESESELTVADQNVTINDIHSWASADGTWQTESVATDPVPTASNGHSRRPDISDDPRFVVFHSEASILDDELIDDGQHTDIFFLDRETGAVERYPHAGNGAPANASSIDPTVSADARFVAFSTRATNLFAADLEANLDVVHLDRLTGDMTLISETLIADGDSDQAQIDGSGNRVIFRSTSELLVAGDSNQSTDIFLWRSGSDLERISVSSTETQGDDHSKAARLSSDGLFAVFVSSATNLVNGDTAGLDDIFLRDIASGATERVSEQPGGIEANADSLAADVAAGGRYVAYVTHADNLAGEDRAGLDVLRWDRFTGLAENVSAILPVDEAVTADVVRISDNGRYVVFSSQREIGLQMLQNLWRYDHREAQLVQVSSASVGVGSQARIDGAAIHKSAHYAVFGGEDDGLTPDDYNGFFDIYLSDLRGPPGILGFEQSQIVVDESVGAVELVVQRNNGARDAVSIDYDTTNGSAIGGADFTATSGVLIFGDADDNDQRITVQIIDDDEHEPDQDFRVALTNPQGGANLGPVTQFLITIIDNDPLVDPVFSDSFEAP